MSAAAVAAQYHPTLHYGFYYDDYHFVRPFSIGELRRAFSGSWDPDHIETPYFRPLTTCLFAVRFAFLGYNAVAYHAVSIAMFGLATALFGTFVYAVTKKPAFGAGSAVLLAVQPALPYSAVAWVTNQMHLAQMLITLFAFTWWVYVRRRTAVWWLPFIPVQIAAILIKEDGVMLFAAVIALHLLLKHVREPDLPLVPLWTTVGGLSVVVVALLVYRQSVLPASTRLHGVSIERAWHNVSSALNGVYRLVPAKRPYQFAASSIATLLPLVGLLTWNRVSRTARFLMISGLVLGPLFAAPFVYLVKAEQLYLVPLGATLLLVGSFAAFSDLSGPHRAGRFVVAGTGAACVTVMSLVTTDITRDFAPFSPIVRRADAVVLEWAAVPLELRDYIRSKGGASPDVFDSNPATAVEVLCYGLDGWEMDGARQQARWMSRPVADLYIRRTATRIDIPLRHEIGAFREPTTAIITADGRELDRIEFYDDQWRHSTIAFRPFRHVPLSEMHHVQIRIPRVWVPADVVPGSTDTRSLGLHLGELAVH